MGEIDYGDITEWEVPGKNPAGDAIYGKVGIVNIGQSFRNLYLQKRFWKKLFYNIYKFVLCETLDKGKPEFFPWDVGRAEMICEI